MRYVDWYDIGRYERHNRPWAPREDLWYQEWWLGSMNQYPEGHLQMVYIKDVYPSAVLDGVSTHEYTLALEVFDDDV